MTAARRTRPASCPATKSSRSTASPSPRSGPSPARWARRCGSSSVVTQPGRRSRSTCRSAKLQPSETLVSRHREQREDRRARRQEDRLPPHLVLRRRRCAGGHRPGARPGRFKDADALVARPPQPLGRRAAGRGRDLPRRHADMPLHRPERQGRGLVNVRWHKPVVAIIDEGTRSGHGDLRLCAEERTASRWSARGPPATCSAAAATCCPTTASSSWRSPTSRSTACGWKASGVEPDVAVPFDIRYAAGRDPQLDAAMETILPRVL